MRSWGDAQSTNDWALWRCEACDIGYLDRRPNEASIGKAYQAYYTHENQDNAPIHSLIRANTLGARLARDFLRAAYGVQLGDSLWGGRYIAPFAPARRANWEHRIRHLPAPREPGERLLDIGCGNGEFLVIANRLGYASTGLDLDPAAVAAAQRSGLDARPGQLPETGLPSASYDQITLNHVFEHLHWPQDSLAEISRLLKPGGRLWISQPNLKAAGHHLFGRHWRGLEAPRHLCLFDPDSLTRLLERAGYVNIKLLPPAPHTKLYFVQSLAMRDGLAPKYIFAPQSWTAEWDRRAQTAQRRAMRRPGTAESFTMVAERPRGGDEPNAD